MWGINVAELAAPKGAQSPGEGSGVRTQCSGSQQGGFCLRQER